LAYGQCWTIKFDNLDWCDILRQALAGGKNYSSRTLWQHLAVTLGYSSKSSVIVSDARLNSVSYFS